MRNSEDSTEQPGGFSGDTIELADRILVETLAAGDAIWLPQRRFDGDIGAATYEARRLFLLHGAPWRSGARAGAEEMATRRALKALAGDGFVRRSTSGKVKTTFIALADRGDMYARQLCGLAADADALRIARKIGKATRRDPQTFEDAWLGERELFPARVKGKTDDQWASIVETTLLPALRRQLIDARCDVGGRAFYSLTPAGWNWIELRHARRKAKQTGDRAARAVYDDRFATARHRLTSFKPDGRAGREIGSIPLVTDRARKDGCETDFRAFCETYFPERFCKPWSEDHLRVIRLIETVVLHGGQFAIALPRGAGKTSLCECAVLWAVLYGHHAFVAIIGPEQQHARQRVENLQRILETNESINGDWPEIGYPIRKLGGVNQKKLLYRGRPVRIDLESERITLPDLAESDAGGSMVYSTSLTGQVRGAAVTRADGRVMRPTLVIIDDPQKRESAHSPSQCAMRERIVNGDVLGLAGPGERIAAIMPCTVIAPDDMADRILDRKANPQWRGVRTAMVRKWPANESLWLEYQQVRGEAFKKYDDQPDKIDEVCNAFYAERREKMDVGAEVSWPERMEPGELSAIQHAWNIRSDRGDFVFFAEYQNEPRPDFELSEDALKPEDIVKRTNGHKRGAVPGGVNRITAFIDVQEKALFWIVVGWEDSFSGAVLDYGTEPEQPGEYVTLRELKRTLSAAEPKAGIEGAWQAGFERLADRILGREWVRADGVPLRIERCLIDSAYSTSTEVVYRFCRQSPHSAALFPSRGAGVTAAGRPMSEWKKRPREQVGLNWRVGPDSSRRERRVIFDANFWKTFIAARLRTAMGDPGALTLYGRQAKTHRCLADHLTAEQPQQLKNENTGRVVTQWQLMNKSRDNHWFDGLVGAAVAASILGVSLPGMEVKRKRRRVSYAAMQRAAQAKRAERGW